MSGERASERSPWATDDLAALEDLVWSRLAGGAQQGRSAFKLPAVATAGIDGGAAVRTVVLRGSDRAARRLTLYTDGRSAKVAQLGADPRLAWHWYDHGRSVQVLARSRAVLHRGDDVARAVWDALPPHKRLDYCREPAPGTALASWSDGLPASWSSGGAGEVTAADTEPFFANLVVVHATVDELEVLHLPRGGGHRRARFRYVDGGGASRDWLVP